MLIDYHEYKPGIRQTSSYIFRCDLPRSWEDIFRLAFFLARARAISASCSSSAAGISSAMMYLGALAAICRGNFMSQVAELFVAGNKVSFAVDLTITPTRPPPWEYSSTVPLMHHGQSAWQQLPCLFHGANPLPCQNRCRLQRLRQSNMGALVAPRSCLIISVVISILSILDTFSQY